MKIALSLILGLFLASCTSAPTPPTAPPQSSAKPVPAPRSPASARVLKAKSELQQQTNLMLGEYSTHYDVVYRTYDEKDCVDSGNRWDGECIGTGGYQLTIVAGKKGKYTVNIDNTGANGNECSFQGTGVVRNHRLVVTGVDDNVGCVAEVYSVSKIGENFAAAVNTIRGGQRNGACLATCGASVGIGVQRVDLTSAAQ